MTVQSEFWSRTESAPTHKATRDDEHAVSIVHAIPEKLYVYAIRPAPTLSDIPVAE